MARIIEKIIGEPDRGKKIGVFARSIGLSNAALKKLRYTEGAILLNGLPVFSSERLRAGDRLTLILHEKYEGRVQPEDFPIKVLYEDEDLLVLDKPPFLPTHPSRAHPLGTLANAATAYNIKKGFDCPFRALSRLDAMTSGVVVSARNLAAASALLEDKRYIGIVEGKPEPGSGAIELAIRREEPEAPKRGVFEDGRPAVTLCETLEELEGASLMGFGLVTGRTHQIRVHAAAMGWPILGDILYGTESPLIGRQALHASSVKISLPFLPKTIEVKAELPRDMLEALDRLRKK